MEIHLACALMAEQPPVDFDEYSDGYRDAVEESISFVGADLDFFTQAKADVLLELVRDRIGEPTRASFLDVGCGPGETDRFLKGRVGRLAGVDVAPRMVERASRLNPWAEFRSFEPGKPLPFEDGSFDVCFAIAVLHHVPRSERLTLIDGVKSVLRPGGLLAIFEHNPFNPLTRRAVAGCEFDRDAELLRSQEARRLLREAGLSDPSRRYIVFFTRRSRLLRGIERRLGWLPLGAQYAAFAQRP
jgi:SAM-dependent methyltransferase